MYKKKVGKTLVVVYRELFSEQLKAYICKSQVQSSINAYKHNVNIWITYQSQRSSIAYSKEL